MTESYPRYPRFPADARARRKPPGLGTLTGGRSPSTRQGEAAVGGVSRSRTECRRRRGPGAGGHPPGPPIPVDEGQGLHVMIRSGKTSVRRVIAGARDGSRCRPHEGQHLGRVRPRVPSPGRHGDAGSQRDGVPPGGVADQRTGTRRSRRALRPAEALLAPDRALRVLRQQRDHREPGTGGRSA